MCLWRTKGEAFSPKKTVPTVKNGGGKITLWGCFSSQSTGNLVRIQGIIRGENYIQIHDGNLKESAQKFHLGDNWKFQQDNDPKHTA